MTSKLDFSYQMPRTYDQGLRSRWQASRRRRRISHMLGWAVLALLVYTGADLHMQQTSFSNLVDKDGFQQDLQKCYEAREVAQQSDHPSRTRSNPRWNSITGQKIPVVIQNATVFDGEHTWDGFFDIVFNTGIVQSIHATNLSRWIPDNSRVLDVRGRHVTPGLVDMHSHHLELPYPGLSSTNDVNERPLLGPITPFVRAIDGFTPSDPAIRIIASGGVTSSLILPGSANIVGGEAYIIKNLPFSGINQEPVIEELLLEYGTPEYGRQRYLKMACGENPKHTYHYTRLGLAWLLREQLEQAKELLERQNSWCQSAFEIERTYFGQDRNVHKFLQSTGRLPGSFKLDTLVALLRGQLNLNVHCYTPEDFERMANVLHEFGVHVQAFHHSLAFWQVPELLKSLEENITIAIFAENAFFKAEAYNANLRAPKILAESGIPVALKSDHTGESNNAKYLLDQAATSYSFGLSEEKALQAVTSVPARSLKQSHRIGYLRPEFDADLVIWDDHPLQIGAVPLEVFIDGRSTLGKKVDKHLSRPQSETFRRVAPKQRPDTKVTDYDELCSDLRKPRSQILFTGIQKNWISDHHSSNEESGDLVLLVNDNRISCFDKASVCVNSADTGNVIKVPLKNGFVTPGLIAFGNHLGLQEITSEGSTGDGSSDNTEKSSEDSTSIHFAKYGVHLHSKTFNRAAIGGVTKAISPPLGKGVVKGVSVGLRTSSHATILDGGIWKDDVALHVSIGQAAKGGDAPTLSSAVEKLRRILEQPETGKAPAIYTKASNGSLPVVVEVYNQDDIAQLILLKRDLPTVDLVIYGGHGASLVAESLAKAGISVILTGNRGAPDSWEKKDILVGPPLTDSSAKVLLEAGVQLGLAIRSDGNLHGLINEARWAGKDAALTDSQTVALVSTNIQKILKVDTKNALDSPAHAYTGDFVVWEGNPLRNEGSVVASFQEDGSIAECWPDAL